jgi:membrane fusion protein (multidrug efflux system)
MYREEDPSVPSAAQTDTPVQAKAETLPAAPAPTKPVPPIAAAAASKQKPARSRRKTVFGAIAVVAAIGAAWFGYHWWTVGRFTVTTDDAYVQAYNTTLAAKVSGYLAFRSPTTPPSMPAM